MIILSEKHGVNPTMGICAYCLQPTNEIGLCGRMKGDMGAPRYSILSLEPCEACQNIMQDGIIIKSMDPNKPDDYNGGMVGVKEEWFKDVIKEGEIKDDMLRRRICFMPHDEFNKMFSHVMNDENSN